MREVAAFELCHEKAMRIGVGRLDRAEVCRIMQYLAGEGALGSRLWCSTKVRIAKHLYEGFVVDVSAVSFVNRVSLASGQVISIPGDSLDIYDTVMSEGISAMPHTLTHITPEWLTSVLKGPKYQPQVQDILKFCVPLHTLTSPLKQRVKYFVEGESVSAPKGKPKLLFIKLAQTRIGASAGSVSQQKREIYAYEKILHDFTLQVAPICFHAAFEHSSGLGTIVLQDLGMWRRAPDSGVKSEADARCFAATLARLHERFWDKQGELENHFVDPDRACMFDLEASADGAEEAFETTLALLQDTSFTLSRKVINPQIFSSAHFKAQWTSLHDTALKQLHQVFEDQPKVLAHLNVMPDHIFFGPSTHDPCLLIDWRNVGAAPVGFDLAAAMCAVYSDIDDVSFVDAFFETYHKTLREEGVLVPLEDVKRYARDCLAPLLLLSVCKVEDANLLKSLQRREGDETLWRTGVFRPLRLALKLTEYLVQEGSLELLF